MTIHWRWFDGRNVERGVSVAFQDRDEAEAWMGEHWNELREDRAESVALMDGDVEVYRMSLQEGA